MWYCTNIELMDCPDTFDRLRFATDSSFAHNPNAEDCRITVNDEPIYSPGGQTVILQGKRAAGFVTGIWTDSKKRTDRNYALRFFMSE